MKAIPGGRISELPAREQPTSSDNNPKTGPPLRQHQTRDIGDDLCGKKPPLLNHPRPLPGRHRKTGHRRRIARDIGPVGRSPGHFPPEPGIAGGFVPPRNRDPGIAEPQRGVGRDHAEIRPDAVARGNHHVHCRSPVSC